MATITTRSGQQFVVPDSVEADYQVIDEGPGETSRASRSKAKEAAEDAAEHPPVDEA